MMGFKTIYENGRSDTHAQMIATFQNGDKSEEELINFGCASFPHCRHTEQINA